MAGQRIQNQRSGSCEHGILIPECKYGADASSLATFASDFDGEANQGLQNVRVIFRYLAENALKHSSSSSLRVDTTYYRQVHPVLDEGNTKKIQALKDKCMNGKAEQRICLP